MLVARGDIERFADREQPDRERRDFDAVEQFRYAEGEPRLSGQLVDADKAKRQSEEQTCQSAQRRIAEGRRHRDERDAHQCEIVFRPEPDRDLDEVRRKEGDARGRNGAGNEGADRGGRQRRPAASGLGHLVAFDRGRHRRAFARRVDQDGGGRAAIHAAVIDAGEHDQRAGRIELVGDGQKQRDGQGRSDAGQHADRSAEQNSDQREQKVMRLHRNQHALAERDECIHDQLSNRSIGPAGRLSVRSLSKIRNTMTASTKPDRKVGEECAPSERGGGRHEQDRGRRNEAAAQSDHRDQRREPAKDEQDRLRIARLRFRPDAAKRHDDMADAEKYEAGAITNGTALGPSP